MTTTTNQKPRPIRDRCNSWSKPTRLLVTAATAVIGGSVAFLGLFIGAVVASGCFISCDTARPVLGLVILMIPSFIVAAWSAMVAWAFERPDVARTTFLVTLAITVASAVVIVVTT